MGEDKTLDPKLEEALKGIWDSLTDEQKEKAEQCKTLDELTALAGREGVELPDEVLDAVAGGYLFYNWDTKYSERWEVIRDKDGKVMERFNEDQKEAAKAYAKAHGQSEEQIGWARINEIRKAANPLSC